MGSEGLRGRVHSKGGAPERFVAPEGEEAREPSGVVVRCREGHRAARGGGGCVVDSLVRRDGSRGRAAPRRRR